MYYFAKRFEQNIKVASTFSGNGSEDQFRKTLKFNPPPLDIKLQKNSGRPKKGPQR